MIVADYPVVTSNAVSVTVFFLPSRVQICAPSLAEHCVCASKASSFVLFFSTHWGIALQFSI